MAAPTQLSARLAGLPHSVIAQFSATGIIIDMDRVTLAAVRATGPFTTSLLPGAAISLAGAALCWLVPYGPTTAEDLALASRPITAPVS